MRNAGHLTQHKRKSAVTFGSSTGGARSALPRPRSRARPGAGCAVPCASVSCRPSCGRSLRRWPSVHRGFPAFAPRLLEMLGTGS